MAELLKELFSKKFVEFITDKTKKYYKEFDTITFRNAIFNDAWENYELKERMRHIANTYNTSLPFEYKKQIEILIKVKNDLSYEDSMGLQSMVFQDFVEVYGLDDYETSIKALEVFTINSSSEFAIRQLILRYEDETMNQMKIWAQDKDEHIRRLASEGCRPRLPWAIALPIYKKDPTRVLEVIELLKNDSSKYVQKSVANNLNDISKDNEDIVVNFVAKNLGKSKDLDWVCKHASRTLLKKGHKKILNSFGFNESSHVDIKDFIFDKNVELGKKINFSFSLESIKCLGNLRVEYAIYYKKANGSHSKKVFMISQNEIKTNEKSFSKYLSFKDLTTRKHYKGEHFIALIINGDEKLKEEFQLN